MQRLGPTKGYYIDAGLTDRSLLAERKTLMGKDTPQAFLDLSIADWISHKTSPSNEDRPRSLPEA
jgi:hypothetical protein